MGQVGGEGPPGGLNRLMSAKAPWASDRRREKWVEESRAGVNQYLSHLNESRGWNISPLIRTGERHLGDLLWLGVLQCISSVLGTEKETPRRAALASRILKSSWSRRMLPLCDREATDRQKSSTYQIISPRGMLKCSGAT